MAPAAPPGSVDRDATPAVRTRPAAHGASGGIGRLCAAGRDAVARTLIRLHVAPNAITVCGFVLTLGAAWALWRGASHELPLLARGYAPASWWPWAAAAWLIAAGACDMLDGAVARLGNLKTAFGAVLDSTLDRLSDAALLGAVALHYAAAGNLTWTAVALMALTNSLLISYVKARAENLIEDCSVGFWLRGERIAFLLIGALAGHIPAAVLLIAGPGSLTALRRLLYARAAIAALERGGPAPRRGPQPGWRGWLTPWRHPRGSPGYDVVITACGLFILAAPWLWPELFRVAP